MGLDQRLRRPCKARARRDPALLVRGNQALQTLEAYKVRLDHAATSLTTL